VVICLERDADLHMAQLMPLPVTSSCASKINIGFTFVVLAHLGSHGQRAVKRVCVCNEVNLFKQTMHTFDLLESFCSRMERICCCIAKVHSSRS